MMSNSLSLRFACASAFALSILVAAAPVADAQAPTFSKAFTPPNIDSGSVSTLSFTITNTSPNPVSGMDFTDILPAGVTIAAPAMATNTCAGTLSAPDGGATISLSGGMVGIGTACLITVDVTSSTLGSHVNTSGNLTSSLGDSGPAMATLNVYQTPGFSKVFIPDVIGVGGFSTLTFVIDNTMNPINASRLEFSDTLPAGVELVSGTTSCGGFFTLTFITNTVSIYSQAPAGGTCVISIVVTSSTPGAYLNISTDLTSTLGNSGPATDTLTVIQNPIFTKEFVPASVPPGEATTLTLTLDNSAGAVDISGVDVVDSLPAGLVVANPANATTTCNGGVLSATAGASVVSYTGGSLAAGAACTITADATAASQGSYLNTADATLASLGSQVTANATLVVSQAAIPTQTGWSLLLLVILIALAAIRQLQKNAL